MESKSLSLKGFLKETFECLGAYHSYKAGGEGKKKEFFEEFQTQS